MSIILIQYHSITHSDIILKASYLLLLPFCDFVFIVIVIIILLIYHIDTVSLVHNTESLLPTCYYSHFVILCLIGTHCWYKSLVLSTSKYKITGKNHQLCVQWACVERSAVKAAYCALLYCALCTVYYYYLLCIMYYGPVLSGRI